MKTISKVLAIASLMVGIAVVPQISAHATSAPTDTACINGDVRTNISVTWNSNTNVTVGTLGNKPLCNDETIYFSTYTMPDNYDGKGFQNGANVTATPQTIFASSHVVLAKGSTSPVNLTVAKPADCKNYQVDVYYGPEVTNVTPAGHGKQFIASRLLVKTQDTCATTPVTPVTPTTPTTPVVTPPAELPHTGVDSLLTVVTGLALGVVAYVGAYIFTKKVKLELK